MDDLELVRAARGGNASAFTTIFDRHAAKVHDLAFAVLRDRQAAYDVVHATFRDAAAHLHELEEPHRLPTWLLAITRYESALRAGATAGPDRLPALPADDPERSQQAALVWEAVADLPLRDRTMLDLDLRQGTDGQDLADAMGIGLTPTYELQSRMRDRVEKGLSGYLIARTADGRCGDLAKLSKGWDGRFAPPMGKKLADHVEGCRTCNQVRYALPSPFALYASALPAAFPAAVRSSVVDGAVPVVAADPAAPGAAGGEAWMPNGFPPPSFVVDVERTRRVGLLLPLVALAAAVLLIAGIAYAATRDDDGTTDVAVDGSTTTLFGGPVPSFSTTSSLPPTAVDPSATTGLTTASSVGTGSSVAPGVATTASTAPATTATTVRPAALAAPATIADFPARVNANDPPVNRTVTLQNTGGQPLSFTAASNFPGSLTVTPTTGTIPGGGTATVTVTLNAGNLPEGTFTGRLTFTAGAAGTRATTFQTITGRPPTFSNPNNVGTGCVEPNTKGCGPKIKPVDPSKNACTGQWHIVVNVADTSEVPDGKVTASITRGNAAPRTVTLVRVGGTPQSGIWQTATPEEPITGAEGNRADFVVTATDKFGFTSSDQNVVVQC